MDKISKRLLRIVVILLSIIIIILLFQEFSNIISNRNKVELVNNDINFQIRKLNYCSNESLLSESSGMSMFPYTWEKGLYWSDKVEFKDIELGDVITYYNNINNTASDKTHHAVCNLYSDRLYTCGYNNKVKELVYPEQIISRDCFKK